MCQKSVKKIIVTFLVSLRLKVSWFCKIIGIFHISLLVTFRAIWLVRSEQKTAFKLYFDKCPERTIFFFLFFATISKILGITDNFKIKKNGITGN